MTKSPLSKSMRKFLRHEKSRFRRENLDPQEAEKKIRELVTKVFSSYTEEKSRGNK